MQARHVNDCPHRKDVRIQQSTEVADCRFLEDLLGVTEAGLCTVGRDACEVCCRTALPSQGEINSVIASALSRAAGQIIERGGLRGCDVGRAKELRDWGRANLCVEANGALLESITYRKDAPCCFLGDEYGDTDNMAEQRDYLCRHPDHVRTTIDGCRWCRDWSDKPRPAPPPLSQLVPCSFPRSGPVVRRWAVGVTTAPRRWHTVNESLDSLIRAGWDRPWLFMDSEVPVARRFSRLPRTVRETAVGAWPNFCLSLFELLMREPQADAYMLVEDDVIFYDRQNLREHVEQVLWPSEPPGIVSLYCSSACTQARPGWYESQGPWVRGTLAIIFPREVAKRFVADRGVLEHRWSQGNGLANIDGVIGYWAAREKIPFHFPSPSLVQHIGSASTLWDTTCILAHRRADQFLGDLG